MGRLIGEYKMEANFEGLVRLLATNLYAEPDVFIRELIQNAHDSIIRRQAEQADFQGLIAVEIRREARELVFRDNRLGMGLEEIKEFLSVIGSTGTGGARATLEDEGHDSALALIGQFGIGLLSAFVVADDVIVRTRRQGSDDAYSWRNSGSAKYKLYDEPELTEAGTEIVVVIGPEHTYILDPKRVRTAIVKYCDILPVHISLDGNGPVNAMEAPWHREHYGSEAAKERAYTDYVQHRFPEIALDVIPFTFTEPYRASGVLYISDRHVPDVNTTGVVDVFVRRMFVVGNDTDFLPPWAKFVRGVIDSPDLQPTGARDNIKRGEPGFLALKERLGRLIVERLRYLAKNEPRKFRQINAWHHYHLKGMAFHYDDFFDDVIDMLLFETNNGPMALGDYLLRNSGEAGVEGPTPIYYFAYRDSAAQFYRLADARRWVVINAGSAFEEELLQKYARKNASVRLERIDATDDPELFGRLDGGSEELYRTLELEMEGHLRRQGVPNAEVRVREFDPADLPAVVIVTPESEASVRLRRMVTHPGLGDLEELALEAFRDAGQRPVRLFINAKCELIQNLRAMDRTDPVTAEAFLAVFNAAVLYSHGQLDRASADAIHRQYARMTSTLLVQAEELRKSQQLLSSQRKQVRSLRESHDEASRPPHVVVFMITPFSEEYGNLERAVRSVFEAPPFFFEVVLARDHRRRAELLSNVRAHIARAHGFIAEISELNPNVMLELGGVLIQDGNRPIFSLRQQDASEDVPSDLKAELYVQYDALSTPIDTLATALRERFWKDGRPADFGIKQLLEERKQRFFSRTLLDALDIRLDEAVIARMMGRYSAVEAVIAAAPADLESLGLRDWQVSALQGQLVELTETAGFH